MQFCPKCGAILVQKKKKFGCPRCSYLSKDNVKIVISEKVEEKKGIPVVSSNEAGTLPIIGEKCKECGNEKSYFWTVQTRSGDEAETKFFKCTNCEFTWREYR